MLVPEVERDWSPRSPPAGTSHDRLLDYAYSGHGGLVAASLRVGEREHRRRASPHLLAARAKSASTGRLGLARSAGATRTPAKRRNARLWRIRGHDPRLGRVPALLVRRASADWRVVLVQEA